MSEMRFYTIPDFLDQLGSDAPVPGGGGASALCASVGAGLGKMVLELTSGKKKYREFQEEIDELIVKYKQLTEKLSLGIDKDAEAFEPLSKAYGLPKDTPEEKEQRDKVMEEALLTASNAPLELMGDILEALKLTERTAQIGSRLAISDAGAAVQFLNASMKAASLNVFINTKLMKNRTAAEKLNDRANGLIKEADDIAVKTYKTVLEAIGV